MDLRVSFLEYLFVLYVILDNISPYSGALDRNYYVAETAAILVIILLLIKCLKHKLKFSIFKRWLVLCIPYYVLTASYFAASVSSDVAVTYAAKILVMLPVLILLFCVYRSEGQENRLLAIFVNIMAVIAVLSLFFWVFASQLKIISPTGSLYAQWGTAYHFPSYFGVYFERQRINFFGYNGFRNQGMFCEAPMFSCCLIIALAMQTFIRSKNDQGGKAVAFSVNGKRLKGSTENWKSVVFVITIITTTTTLGILLMLIILSLRYMMIRRQSKIQAVLKYGFAGFAVFAVIYLMGALIVNKMSTISWLERTGDFQVGFRAWKKYPLFGTGFLDYRSMFHAAGVSYNNGFSSAIMAVLGQGGMALSLVYLLPLFGGIIYAVRRRRYAFLAYNVIIWFEVLFTAIPYTFLLLFQLAYFYSVILVREPPEARDVHLPSIAVSQ